MTSIVVASAALVVLLVAVFFALHCEYHAGLAGTVGLGLIAIAAVTRGSVIVDVWLEGRLDAQISPQGVMLWCGLALFLGRQAWTFYRRWRKGGGSFYTLARRGAPRPMPSPIARPK